MSRGLKTLVGVAVAIAIPFAAPAIAGAIGTSMGISAATFGMSAAVGSVLGSAAVGAALGGASQAVLGGDVGRGALMGAVGGGIGGYTSAPSAVGAGAAPPTTVGVSPVDYSLGTGGGATGLSAPTGGVGLTMPGSFGAPATSTGLAGAGTAGSTGFTGADYSLASAAQSPATGLASAGLDPTTAGAGLRAPDSGYFQAGTATGATAAAKPATFMDALSEVPKTIAAKFKDPKALADITLRAAGQLAGSALAGSGLSPEEETLLAQQTDELRNLQQTNQALFNQKLEQAQNLMGESKYFDPEYFGLQSARRAQTAGAVAKRTGLRGLTGDRRESEARRFDIESGRRTGTAYDTGFMSAISPRRQTQEAGLAQMPGYLAYQTPTISAQLGAQGVARTRRAEDREGIADLFGPLYK